MAERLEGKLAVVTGASSGIGRAIANELAVQGASVIGLARSFEGRKLELRGGAVAELCVDVTSESAVAALFASLEFVDLLVHAAGVGYFARAESLDADQLREMLDVHVVGAAQCTRAALPALRARSGQVIFIGSMTTRQDFVDCAGYAAAKYGQLGYARALAAEERGRGLRITTAIVGATDTGIWQERTDFDRNEMARPADIAELIVGLVTDKPVVIDEIVLTPPLGVIAEKSSRT